MTTTLQLNQTYAAGLDRELARLSRPGTWWTGAERVALAAVARAAREVRPHPTTGLPAPATAAAMRLSSERHADGVWIGELTDAGLIIEAYVEILGIVARLAALDSFLFGIGAEPRPLPAPVAGEPSRELVADAKANGGLVPTVGPASAPNALSAVPAETDAMHDLHGVLYLSLAEMADLQIEKSLTRPQMEFVAARTSFLNECFF